MSFDKRTIFRFLTTVAALFCATTFGDPLSPTGYSLEAAVASAGSGPVTMLLTTAMGIAEDLTIPSNISLNMVGGTINVPAGLNLYINGSFTAPMTKVFSGGGSIHFAAGFAPTVFPQWLGATGDGYNDDSEAIQLAINSLPPASSAQSPVGVVSFAPGTYRVTSSIVVTNLNVLLSGGGPWQTRIQADPALTSEVLHFLGSASSPPPPHNPQAGMINMSVAGAGPLSGTTCVSVDSANSLSFTSAWFDSCRYNFYVMNQSSNITVTDSVSEQGYYGYLFIASQAVQLVNSQSYLNVGTGLTIRAAQQAMVINSQLVEDGEYGLWIDQSAGVSLQNVTVEAISGRALWGAGVRISASSNVTSHNLQVSLALSMGVQVDSGSYAITLFGTSVDSTGNYYYGDPSAPTYSPPPTTVTSISVDSTSSGVKIAGGGILESAGTGIQFAGEGLVSNLTLIEPFSLAEPPPLPVLPSVGIEIDPTAVLDLAGISVIAPQPLPASVGMTFSPGSSVVGTGSLACGWATPTAGNPPGGVVTFCSP